MKTVARVKLTAIVLCVKRYRRRHDSVSDVQRLGPCSQCVRRQEEDMIQCQMCNVWVHVLSAGDLRPLVACDLCQNQAKRRLQDYKNVKIVSIKMKERVPYLCRYDHNLS